MSLVRAKDTRPELLVRRTLHRAGYRYRLHVRSLPGRPDLVFPKSKAVLFVNGCFWHGHNCHRFSWPQTRIEFWRSKILGNKSRDNKNYEDLSEQGWRVGVVWSCALQGRGKLGIDAVSAKCQDWLDGDEKTLVVSGTTANDIEPDNK